jgi:hypothetical protein
MRVLAFIVRRPDVSRDAFRAHYEDVHVPTALPFLGGITAYVRHHIREELYGAATFDCMTAFDYRDEAAVQAVLKRVESPQAAVLRRDELTFMDVPRNHYFAVRDASPWQRPAAPEAAVHLLACVRRPPAEKVQAFCERFLVEALPALETAVDRPDWLRLQFALGGSGPGAAFDAVAQIGARGAGGLAGWARALEASGASVVTARVTAHATPMAP